METALPDYVPAATYTCQCLVVSGCAADCTENGSGYTRIIAHSDTLFTEENNYTLPYKRGNHKYRMHSE